MHYLQFAMLYSDVPLIAIAVIAILLYSQVTSVPKGAFNVNSVPLIAILLY